MTHAKNGRGGSVATRTMNCPGWHTLPAREEAPSAYADRGSMLHEAAVLADEGKLAVGFEAYGQTLTAELMREKIEPALEALHQVLPEVSLVMHENKVQLPLDGCFGTADVVALSTGMLMIADFKFGDGVMVSPVENDQLAYYAAGALYSMPQLADYEGPVRLAIIQPGNGDGYAVWETDTDWIEDWLGRYEKALEQPPAFALGSWCRFCPAKLSCPAMHKSVEAASGADKDEVHGLSGEDLGAWMDDVPYLEGFIKAVQAEAMARLENGQPVTGYKLVPKRAVRKWENEPKVEVQLRALRVKVGDMMNMKLKSPAQIEKLPLKGKQLKGVTNVVSELAVSHSSGHNVVPDSDPRAKSVTLASAAERLSVLSGNMKEANSK